VNFQQTGLNENSYIDSCPNEPNAPCIYSPPPPVYKVDPNASPAPAHPAPTSPHPGPTRSILPLSMPGLLRIADITPIAGPNPPVHCTQEIRPHVYKTVPCPVAPVPLPANGQCKNNGQPGIQSVVADKMMDAVGPPPGGGTVPCLPNKPTTADK
jgi:hypothetical protein